MRITRGVGLALISIAACLTDPTPVAVRDPDAPFQTSELHYDLRVGAPQFSLRVPVGYVNRRAQAIVLDPCRYEFQRGDREGWRTVYAPRCTVDVSAFRDTVAPGQRIDFEFSIGLCTVDGCFPYVDPPATGRYRILFGIRDRIVVNPGLVLLKLIDDIDARRSNEFVAEEPR